MENGHHPASRSIHVAKAQPWLDWLLPPTMRTLPPDDLRRSRLVASFSFAFGTSAGLSYISSFFIAFDLPLMPVLFAAIFHTINLSLMWIVRSYKLTSVLFLSCVLFVTGWLTYLWGGLLSPVLSWHIVLPLLALFLLGRWWGIVFLTLVIIQTSAFFIWQSGSPLDMISSHGYVMGTFSSVVNLLIVSFFLMWLYDSAREKMLDALEKSATERERIAAERDKERLANETKTTFLAHVSHELRTPLNAIIGYAELLDEELPGHNAEALSPDVQRISDAGQLLLGLVSDLLYTTQLELGQLSLTPRHFVLQPFLDELYKSIAPLAQRNGNQVEFDNKLEPMCELNTDQLRLQQCLYKLLSNAAKFTSQGQIELLVEQREENIAFAIKDTGIGMDEETVERLFQAFSQGDSSPTKKHAGLGLGLAICHQLTQLMGGSLTVESKPEKGSLFTLQIPMNSDNS